MGVPGELVRRADQAAERYEEAWHLRSAIQAIPYLGSVIDNIITGKIAAVQRERLQRFMDDLREDYSVLSEGKVDKDFLRSEEFIDLFVMTAERVARANGRSKVDALRNAFVNATTIDGSAGPLKEVVIRLVGDVTADHVRVLRVIADREQSFSEADRSNNADYTDFQQIRGTRSELSEIEIQAIVYDLVSMGLLRDWWIGRFDQPNELTRVHLTRFGREFIKFITAPS